MPSYMTSKENASTNLGAFLKSTRPVYSFLVRNLNYLN